MHRIVYLFACLSEKCISKTSSIRAFREIIHDKNKFTRIANDDDFDNVVDMNDAEL